MDNGTLRLALDHATKGRHYDSVESDVVKAVVSSHAARHVGGIVKPLKKTLIIEIKCLASGMGRNPRCEDHAELSPSLTVLVVGPGLRGDLHVTFEEGMSPGSWCAIREGMPL